MGRQLMVQRQKLEIAGRFSPPTGTPPTLEQAHKERRAARKQLIEILKNATESGKQYLHNRAAAEALADNADAAKVAEKLIRIEELRRTFQKLKGTQPEKRRSGTLSHIKVPYHDKEGVKTQFMSEEQAREHDRDQPIHWESIYHPVEMTEFLICRNKHHFGQSH